MVSTFIVAALSLVIALGALHSNHKLAGGTPPVVPIASADGDTISGGGPPGH